MERRHFSYLTQWHVIIKLSGSVLYSNACRKLLTSGSVVASVTQAQIHVINDMANFVIFPGLCVCVWQVLVTQQQRQAVDEGRK